MMKIKLWPDLVDWPIEASVKGDVLTINGEDVDLSVIPEGFRLPGSAVGNKFFVESEVVERKDGVLYLTIRLPVDWNSPEEYRNPPEPLVIEVKKGVVPLPDTSPPVEEPLPPIPVEEEEEPEAKNG